MYGKKFLRQWLRHSLAKLCTKKYENPSIFVKVTAKKSVAPFLSGHVYASHRAVKIVIFTYPGLHFLFALGTPLRQSRKTLHEWKDNSVLAKPLAACTHLSSTVSQLGLFEPQVQKSPFSRTAAHIFVSPGDAPATITQYVPWMERKFNACQTPCSMYLSIFNSFRVVQCLSQCVSPKIAIFTTFLQRDAMQARSLLSCSVCPSRSWIASKRIEIASNFFHHRVPTPF